MVDNRGDYKFKEYRCWESLWTESLFRSVYDYSQFRESFREVCFGRYLRQAMQYYHDVDNDIVFVSCWGLDNWHNLDGVAEISREKFDRLRDPEIVALI